MGDSTSGAEMLSIGLDFLLPQQVLGTLEKHNPVCWGHLDSCVSM